MWGDMNTARQPLPVSAEGQILGCLTLQVVVSFLVVNIKFINLTLWWGKVGWEILRLGRICLGGFSEEEY